jgi:zeaxanthin glucosyltransferase
MSRIGFFCFLGRGHLDPAMALGRALAARGHEVTIFHVSMARATVLASGLKFCPIDVQELQEPERIGERSFARFKWQDTLDGLQNHARRVLREGPAGVKTAGIEALIADQSDLAAGSVAEMIGIPFITLSCAPAAFLEEGVPAPFFGWHYRKGPAAAIRNGIGNAFIDYVLRPVLKDVNEWREQRQLRRLEGLNDTFSRLGTISQLPESFDFPRRHCPRLFYAGPLQAAIGNSPVKFPWQRLNGKPLIYASMGTIRNTLPWVFRTISAACACFDMQLVLSLGGGRLCPEDMGKLPGDPVVVHYAPQTDLLRRAALVINCAGLNTTLGGLSNGVPIVAIPIAEDQPGVAARIARSRTGVVVPLRRLSVKTLRNAIRRVMEDPAYRAAARRYQSEMARVGGAEQAAEIAERLLGPVAIGQAADDRRAR